MPVYSPSRLERFRTCPRAYFYGYIAAADPIEGFDTIEAFRGTIVHAALEHLYRDVMHGRVPDSDGLVSHYRALWKSQYHKGIEIPNGDLTPAEYRRAGEQWLRRYHADHQPFDESVTIVVEEPVTLTLDKPGKYRMRGYVDRIARRRDGTFEIHDYKTSSYLPSQENLDHDRQLTFYEIALRQRWPEIEQVDLVWHYLQKEMTLTSRRTNEQLQELRDETITLISDIETRGRDGSSFPPCESGLCDWCQYQHLCPDRRHLFETESLAPQRFAQDSGVTLVDQHTRLQGRINKLQDKLRDLQAEQEAIEQALTTYAQREGLSQIAGSTHVAVIRLDTAPILPTKADEPEAYADVDARLRRSKIWPEVSILDRHKLIRIWRGEQSDPGRVKAMLSPYVQSIEAVKVTFRQRKMVDAAIR